MDVYKGRRNEKMNNSPFIVQQRYSVRVDHMDLLDKYKSPLIGIEASLSGSGTSSKQMAMGETQAEAALETGAICRRHIVI